MALLKLREFGFRKAVSEDGLPLPAIQQIVERAARNRHSILAEVRYDGCKRGISG